MKSVGTGILLGTWAGTVGIMCTGAEPKIFAPLAVLAVIGAGLRL